MVILGVLLSTSIALKIAQLIAVKVLIDPVQGIKHRRLWSLFELFMLYLAIVGGLLSALSRIIMLIVLSMVGLARLDQSLFPEWINDVIYLDSANKTYLGMLFMFHSHNHPVAVTFLNFLKRERDLCDDAFEEQHNELSRVKVHEQEQLPQGKCECHMRIDKSMQLEDEKGNAADRTYTRNKMIVLGLLLQNEALRKQRQEQVDKLKEELAKKTKPKKDETEKATADKSPDPKEQPSALVEVKEESKE